MPELLLMIYGKSTLDKYEVLLSPYALRDLENIYRYVKEELLSENVASNLINKIRDSILGLEEMPERGAIRKVGRFADSGYRQIFVKNYIVVYRVNTDHHQVIVVTVRYTPSHF